MAAVSEPKLIGKGANGNVYQKYLDTRVEKESKYIFSEMGVALFRWYFLSKCPSVLQQIDTSENYIGIPANKLTKGAIKEILSMLVDLKMLNSQLTPQVLITNLKNNHQLATEFKVIKEREGENALELYIVDLLDLLMTLREFIIVEYLNAINSSATEHMVHNIGLFVHQVANGYMCTIQLEDWSGSENKDFELEKNDRKNLYDLIVETRNIKDPNELAVKVNNLVDSMVPIASTVDFINSKTYKRAEYNHQDVNGKDEVVKSVVDAPKIPFGHYDIKVTNIFARNLSSNENADKEYESLILGDFDSAALFTKPMGALGTPLYLAPELFSKDTKVDVSKSDIYSFAVTLFIILTGKAPQLALKSEADSDNPNRVPRKYPVYDLKKGIFDVETNLIIDLDDEKLLLDRGIATHDNLDAIIGILARGMAINPSDRYSSCTQMMEELKREMNSSLRLQKAS